MSHLIWGSLWAWLQLSSLKSPYVNCYVIRCTGANESESFQRAQEWIAEVVRGALGRQQFLQAQLHPYNCVFQLMMDEQVSKVAF